MSGTGKRAEDVARTESRRAFVMTLIVSTAMAALTAWVLGYAMLAPERSGANHGSAVLQHMRS